MTLQELSDREAIRERVLRGALLLDEEKFEEWLDLFSPEGGYVLCAYSNEIRRWMTWWRSERAELDKMLAEVREHVRDAAVRRHVLSAPVVALEGERARALSHFSLYRTLPDGQSSLYMVGRYEDSLIKRDGVWRYLEHKVIADTRLLDTFTHIPV